MLVEHLVSCAECRVRWSCSLEADGPPFSPCKRHIEIWKELKMKLWKYDQVQLRDDVKLGLPEDWAAFIYKITSGDSGKTYYTTLLTNPKTKQTIQFCTCPEGMFRAPLAVLDAVPFLCKHTENLLEFLRQKGEKRTT